MPCNAHAQHRVSYGVDFLSGSLMSRVDMAWPLIKQSTLHCSSGTPVFSKQKWNRCL